MSPPPLLSLPILLSCSPHSSLTPGSPHRRQHLEGRPWAGDSHPSPGPMGPREGGPAASLPPAQVRTPTALAPQLTHTYTPGGVVLLVLEEASITLLLWRWVICPASWQPPTSTDSPHPHIPPAAPCALQATRPLPPKTASTSTESLLPLHTVPSDCPHLPPFKLPELTAYLEEERSVPLPQFSSSHSLISRTTPRWSQG